MSLNGEWGHTVVATFLIKTRVWKTLCSDVLLSYSPCKALNWLSQAHIVYNQNESVQGERTYANKKTLTVGSRTSLSIIY